MAYIAYMTFFLMQNKKEDILNFFFCLYNEHQWGPKLSL